MSYATIAQYEARYGSVSDETMLQACLDDCTVAIDVALGKAGIDAEDVAESRLMMACRGMANRVMPSDAGEIPQGATSMSMGAVGFTQSYSFATAYALPKLTGVEYDLLGISRGGIGVARPSYGILEPEEDEDD